MALGLRGSRQNGLLSPTLSSRGGEGEDPDGPLGKFLNSMAVPPGERENRRRYARKANAAIPLRIGNRSPSPKGEGWGEGKRNRFAPIASVGLDFGYSEK